MHGLSSSLLEEPELIAGSGVGQVGQKKLEIRLQDAFCEDRRLSYIEIREIRNQKLEAGTAQLLLLVISIVWAAPGLEGFLPHYTRN